jgi:ABC-type branched-subunit amino acid transport system substrate-binding protein
MIATHVLSVAFGLLVSQTGTDEGVKADRILVGMSTALSGPSQGLGLEMKRGVDAYFAEVNAAGGVFGRRFELIALDDGYEPARAGPNMHALIESHHVFGILGNVGTPTAIVSVPIALEAKVPFFGAFTGAGLLRKSPPDRWVINYRASYAEETAAMIEGLVGQIKIAPNRIAFFTQNDAYGDSGYAGAIKALRAKGFLETSRLVHGRYQRNTENVEDGLSRILEARIQPEAVIMVGSYKACAKFVHLAKQEGLRALFLNVSFVGAEALLQKLGPKDGEGVIVTQVVPPLDADLPAVRAYGEAIGRGKRTFGSLEGYLAAKAFADGVRRAGQDLVRERFIDAFERASDIDLGLGLVHALSPTEHQISHNVWPTIVHGGTFHALDWSVLGKERIAAK